MSSTNMDSCKLHLSAHASVEHPAERAVLHIRLMSSGEDQEAIAKDVVDAKHALLSEINKIHVIDADGKATQDSPTTLINTTALSNYSSMVPIGDEPENDGYIHAHRQGRDNRPKRRVYTSQSSMEVRFRDFSLLSDITSKFATVPHAEVQRVEWKILPETEARLQVQARKDALREAIKRASDYCEVASIRSCRPVDIHDKGYTSNNGVRPQAPYTRSGDMELQPEHKSVGASVEVEFMAQY